MNRAFRFALLFVVALAVVPFLPTYIEHTFMRSWRTDHVGDVIEWGWKICTLKTFRADYPYMAREQAPAFWLAVNFALALFYALLIAVGIDLFLARSTREKSSD